MIRAQLTMRPLKLAPVLLLALCACSQPPSQDPDGGPAGCDPAVERCGPLDPAQISAQIANVRAVNGPSDIPIEGAWVTYVVMPHSSHKTVHGFFVQAEKEGPALFVRVDPTTLEPQPKVGDRVQFRVMQVLKEAIGRVEAREIASFERLAEGEDVSFLVQDLTNKNALIESRETYDGELVRLEGHLLHEWIGPGNWVNVDDGLWFTAIGSKGGYSNSKFVFAAPQSLADHMGHAGYCKFVVDGVPFRIGYQSAQLWIFDPSEFGDLDCPDAELTQALALSETSVQLTFNRPIAPQTLSASSGGLSFGGGLTATGVEVDGRIVRVSTSPQQTRQAYTVDFDDSVRDVLGAGVKAPQSKRGFQGYFQRAGLVLNELFCAGPEGRDLIELRVVTSGSTANLSLHWTTAKPVLLGVFPDTPVEEGDLIVVHLNTNPLRGDAVYSETLSKDEQSRQEFPSNYVDAWDFVYEDAQCEVADGVMRVRHIDGSTMDGVALINSTNARHPGYSDWLRELQLEGHWEPRTCGGQTCGPTTSPTINQVSVDQRGVRIATSGRQSIARTAATDTNGKEDWGPVGPWTMGRPNN
jgi:hypothetical protein